jgi:hypothetical protein
MPTNFEKNQTNRFERMQINRASEKQSQLNQYTQSKDIGINKNTKTIIGKIPGYLNKANDLLYSEFAKQQDASDLLSIENEIEARIKSSGVGVLIKRLTKMIPDSAGNFLPQYIGLQIASDGLNELVAQSNYDAKKNPSKSQASNDGICTPINPTGGTDVDGPSIGPAPEGYNMGYASQLANKIMSVYESNPNIIGKITFDSIDSPIQPLAYIKEEFFFISKVTWLNRDGICRPDYK